MKDIAKIVHLPSVVQSELYEATRILFVRKENKNNDNNLSHLSAAPHGYVFYISLRFDLNKNSVSVWCGWHRTAYAVCVQRIISKMALRWCRWDKLLNKVVIFIFFAYKKYSRRFIKFRLNHWWQMDYFGDVFHTFLGLDSVIYLAVNGTVKSLPVFIQNILNCVPKTNKAFLVWNDMGVSD